MSTSLHTASLFPTWKLEVNRRVAAHLSSKTAPAGEAEASSESRPAAASRAARAAARVAARYANAPSYSAMLAGEAHVALGAAQAESRAAQEEQAAVQYVLDGLEAAASAEPASEPVCEPQTAPEPITRRRAAPVLTPFAQHAAQPRLFEESPLFASYWEPLAGPAEPTPLRSMQYASGPAISEVHAEGWDGQELPGNPGHCGDPAQPIYANLIEFPRPMVAARKVRPRLAEGPLAQVESVPQLSIFEVDPGTISIEPTPAAVEEPAVPAWMLSQWPAMEPEAQPYEEFLEEAATQAAPAMAVEAAPMSRRLLATVVDCALIAASFLAAAMLIASNARQLPSPRLVESDAMVAMLVIGVAYQVFFFTLGRATPGMWYAGIQFSTFAGLRPNRAQRCGRLLALPLSVLPLGLGLAWALFDDGQLAWHDRLSRTYLRKR